MKRFIWPLDKVFITQGFGSNPAYYKKYGMKGHNGIDFRTRFIDSPLGHRYVVAMDGGTVLEVNRFGSGYGTHIKIRHKDGSVMTYAHLFKSYVFKGQVVKQGQRIAVTNNTGDSSGPHLHVTFKPDKADVNNGYGGAVDFIQQIQR